MSDMKEFLFKRKIVQVSRNPLEVNTAESAYSCFFFNIFSAIVEIKLPSSILLNYSKPLVIDFFYDIGTTLQINIYRC